MKRTVDVRAGVGHHIDATDLKLGAWGISASRGFARQIVTDEGCREPLVGEHPGFNRVADVDQLHKPSVNFRHENAPSGPDARGTSAYAQRHLFLRRGAVGYAPDRSARRTTLERAEGPDPLPWRSPHRR